MSIPGIKLDNKMVTSILKERFHGLMRKFSFGELASCKNEGMMRPVGAKQQVDPKRRTFVPR